MMQQSDATTILVVEDGQTEREALARMLRVENFRVVTAPNPIAALEQAQQKIDLVISDLRMGTTSGIDLLREWRQTGSQIPFIILTAYGDISSAVRAMKFGATDFLPKPVDPVQLLSLIREQLAHKKQSSSSTSTSEQSQLNGIIGHSRVILEACESTLRAAKTNSTILILGETGTGKELFAEAIHQNSPRSKGPFVVVNMAAIPDTLVESELFGHIAGAYTGASQGRVGRFEAAHGGTLFIDEIGDFPLHLQAKLLRVLESRSLSPVGSGSERRIDVRIVAATSRPLEQMKNEGLFRDDLYFRLNVVSIHLPPLRERRQDIALLVRHFLDDLALSTGTSPRQVSPELMRTLERLDWPGNVRQLRNALESMCVMAPDHELSVSSLPPDLRTDLKIEDQDRGKRLDLIKDDAMRKALEQFGGNRTRAAAFLGISIRTLQRKLRQWEVNRDET